jgi:hypothetical protein
MMMDACMYVCMKERTAGGRSDHLDNTRTSYLREDVPHHHTTTVPTQYDPRHYAHIPKDIRK